MFFPRLGRISLVVVCACFVAFYVVESFDCSSYIICLCIFSVVLLLVVLQLLCVCALYAQLGPMCMSLTARVSVSVARDVCILSTAPALSLSPFHSLSLRVMLFYRSFGRGSCYALTLIV